MMSNLGSEVSSRGPAQSAATVVTRKLSTAGRVLRDAGPRGILSVVALKAVSILHAPALRRVRTALRLWAQQEHWWVGLLVVAKGNVVRVDSCTFVVSHPAIRTASKSLFLLGRYERAERVILSRYLDPAQPVIELGGSIGVVACVTNRLLRNPRAHVVVEANPDLIPVLTGNRDRNGCAFTVMNRAVAYGTDSTTFFVDDKDFLGSSVQVRTARAIQVPAVTLGRIIDEHGFDACTLVCDIEGGEMELVQHERRVLQERVSMIIVEVHGWRVGWDRADEMIQTLKAIGFRCLQEAEGTYVFRNERLRAAAQVNQVSS